MAPTRERRSPALPALLALICCLCPASQAIPTAELTEELMFTPSPLDPGCTFDVPVNEARGAYITSPGYPDGYTNNAHCQWKLVAQSGSIVLKVVKFLVEASVECMYDSLHIWTELPDSYLGRFCGDVLIEDDIIETNASIVHVVFVSDSNFNDEGFKFEYYTDVVRDVSKGGTSSCSAVLTARSGTFSSPGYPVAYAPDEHCQTLISVSQGSVIAVDFEDISIESSNKCEADYVELFDGPTDDSPSLGRFCGSARVRGLTSSSNTALVVFHSDDVFQDAGFNASYESILPTVHAVTEGPCGNIRVGRNGTWTSPNWPKRYSANQFCSIHLSATKSRLIEIVFEYFLIEKSPDCEADFLEIYDKDPAENSLDTGHYDWRLVARLCGDGVPQRKLISTSNELLLKFSSDSFSELGGFKLVYRLLTPTVEKVTKPPRIDAPPLLAPELMFREIFPERNVSLASGEEYALSCIPKNINADIVWYKDSDLLSPAFMRIARLEFISKYLLYVRSMTNETQGTYTCAVVLQNKRSEMSVMLRLRKEASADAPSSCSMTITAPVEINATSGENPVLSCKAYRSHRHPLDYHWLRNFQPLETVFVGTFTGTSRFRTTASRAMYVSGAEWTDTGIYTCVVTDTVTNCTTRQSMLLRVRPKDNMDDVCGVQRVSMVGQTDSTNNGKIISGSTVRRGSHPWMVMLSTKDKRAFCGGSLLNRRWVLTAAHCLSNLNKRPEELEFALGKHNQDQEEETEVLTRFEKIIFNPNYNPTTFDSDIALVKLSITVQFTDYILPICLGDTEFIRKTFFSFKDLRYGTVAGWGKLSEKGSQSKYLKEIKLPLVEPEKCLASTQFLVTTNMFCAGYDQEIVGDACKGDSGGGFIVEEKGRWYVIGVVSWGVGCGRSGKYGFYTKVDNYHNWIKEHISY